MRPVTKIAGTILLGIMLFGVFRNAVLYVIYENNTGLFIAVFCENKNRPQLNCNGQCRLAKMQQEHDEKEAASMLEQLQSEIMLYSPCCLIDSCHGDLIVDESIVQISFYNQSYSFLFAAELVKPPDITAFC